MRDRNEPQTHGRLPPETALSLLSNGVRAAIMWQLSEARGGGGPPPVLSFSTLRSRAAPDVDSSRFNYHLKELVGIYVERVDPDTEATNATRPVPQMAGEREAGYQLTPEGTTLIRTIRAWSTMNDTDREFSIDQSCFFCGTGLTARYESSILAVECPACAYLYDYNLTPPGVFYAPGLEEADDDTVLDRAAEYNRHIRLGFARGICPYCGNGVDAAFQDPSQTGYPRSDRRKALIRRGCAHCGNKDNLTVGELLLKDARLISFCHDHGLDVTTTPIWDMEFAATDCLTTVRSRDPWEVSVRIEMDGDRLTLDVDASLTINTGGPK